MRTITPPTRPLHKLKLCQPNAMSLEVTQPLDEVGTHFYNPSKYLLRNLVWPPSRIPTSVITLRPQRPRRERF